jgi:hypothetical protein
VPIICLDLFWAITEPLQGLTIKQNLGTTQSDTQLETGLPKSRVIQMEDKIRRICHCLLGNSTIGEFYRSNYKLALGLLTRTWISISWKL